MLAAAGELQDRHRRSMRPTLVARGPRCRHRHRARAIPAEIFADAPKLRAAIRHGAGARHDPGRRSDRGRRAGRQRARRQCPLGRRACVLRDAWRCLRRFRMIDRDLRPAGWLAGRDHADKLTILPAARSALSAWALSARRSWRSRGRLRARRDRQQPQARRVFPTACVRQLDDLVARERHRRPLLSADAGDDGADRAATASLG